MVKGITNSDTIEGINRVFLWLEGKTEDFYADYIDQDLNLNIMKLRADFYHQFKRYFIIRRGFSYIIKDTKTDKEIFQFPFTEDTKDKVYAEVVHTCEMLNNKELKPINHKHKPIHCIPDEHHHKHCHHKVKVYDLSIIVRDETNQPISGASVILANKIEKTTDDTGVCTFASLKSGAYTFSVSADNYMTKVGHVYVEDDITSRTVILQSLLDMNTQNSNTNSDNSDNNNTTTGDDSGITTPTNPITDPDGG